MPTDGGQIEVHVSEVKSLFNAMDPAPFRQRDLDPNAEEFIVGWSRELRSDVPLTLVVHLDRTACAPEEEAAVREAVHVFFKERALVTRRKLRQLFRVGRTSLLIGLVFLASAIVVGDLVGTLIAESRYASIVRESLVIGGWVAMWRPLEVFLYDWWPIRAEAQLYDRLGSMIVRIVNANPLPA